MRKYQPVKEQIQQNPSPSSVQRQNQEHHHVHAPEPQGNYFRGVNGMQPPELSPSFFQNFVHSILHNNTQYQEHPTCTTNDQQMFHHNSCSENMIQSIMNIVQQQNQALQNLSTKVNQVTEQSIQYAEKLKKMQQEKKNMEKIISMYQQDKKSITSSTAPELRMKIQGEQVNTEQLIQMLFGRNDYQYELRLAEDIGLPLYRERNFNLKIGLFDDKNEQINNSNKIPMSLGIYTCENPPKFLQKNTSGQKMLKGFIEQTLLHGECLFQKIQIREVTSHYREGWVFVVVIPCMTPLGEGNNQNFIDFKLIKPLAISNIVVKAKKPKKAKDATAKKSVQGQVEENSS